MQQSSCACLLCLIRLHSTICTLFFLFCIPAAATMPLPHPPAHSRQALGRLLGADREWGARRSGGRWGFGQAVELPLYGSPWYLNRHVCLARGWPIRNIMYPVSAAGTASWRSPGKRAGRKEGRAFDLVQSTMHMHCPCPLLLRERRRPGHAASDKTTSMLMQHRALEALEPSRGDPHPLQRPPSDASRGRAAAPATTAAPRTWRSLCTGAPEYREAAQQW
jgi:hypothetical protein